MELSSVIFPSPPPTYTYSELCGSLIFIPRAQFAGGVSKFGTEKTFGKEPHHIPCLYMPVHSGSSKVLLYFHGNAEDLGNTYDLLKLMRDYLGIHMIAVEYPNYGIYSGSPTAGRLVEDATNVFDYIANECGWGAQNIIVAGRSIGSGPAIHLSAARLPAAMLLISAYTSIRAAAKNVAGRLLQYAVKERFDNKKVIAEARCPILLVHGLKDKLVPYSHSEELFAQCKGVCLLHLPPDMDHCTLDYTEDLCKPLKDFLVRCGVTAAPEKDRTVPKFLTTMFILPKDYPSVAPPGLFKKFILKFV